MNNQLKKLKVFTILYVEDDSGIRENFKEILKHYFKDVFVAKSSKEAYQSYIKQKPDLLITDIKMENMSGIDLIKKIRQTDKNIKIIITSAYTNLDYLLVAAELNLIKYIVKPITNAKLFEAFDSFLKSNSDETIHILKDNWYFNSKKSIISNEIEEFILTKKEILFLELLLSKKSVISYEEIFNHICDDNLIMSQNAMRQFIKNLRKKLPLNYLKNIQGVGYYIDV
ncbi:DNA-binding response regulator [Aliarcobacter trophiarum LMG 25534]|uniref:DNA-binding response regulator n=1 Tax=Aliarcobacter trophiarum LMG 25534 TaxID=1032241 RepID=A0AAD0QMS7_9BACT|nr:response regulator transcription factor [Aliarcobacter trophiarum]AXK49295.1 two-component system response regulator [Aliarcobacter trophiarum LMG 25534]RXJ91429.1 DNA-binding response regulator [Aliarcobacter trophiarum LMG 25534]